MEPIKKPFEPVAEQEYAVTYTEHGEERTLLGTIVFPDNGGVIVTRTRAKVSQDIWLSNPVKIEPIT